VSTQHRRVSTDPFPDLVAKQLDRFGYAYVSCLVPDQVGHVRTGLGRAEQSLFMIGELVELLGCQIFALHQVPSHTGIQVRQDHPTLGGLRAGSCPSSCIR
jgi:hypothetical protein